MSNTSNSSIQPTTIIWFGLTMSQFIYGVVGMTISPEIEEGNDILIVIFLVIGLFNAVLAFLLAPKFFKVTSKENAFSLCILQWALIESIAVFGLVGKILAGSVPFMAGMLTMSIIFMLLLFPSEKRLNAMIQSE